MNKLSGTIRELHQLHNLAERDQWVNRINPLVKLLLTIFYIAGIMHLGKYCLKEAILGGILPLMFLVLADIPLIRAVYRVRWIVIMFFFMGMGNMLFEGTLITFMVLVLKGAFCALAGYCLVASTTIEKICYAMRLLRIPAIIVTQIQLMYRYISLLLGEAWKLEQAYALRAPGQKGVHFKVWGSLLGQLLLRSIDRAKHVYESMLLRGYCGEFKYEKKEKRREMKR